MKIQCDVCNKDEASVFCTADEAALCDACDHRVHHANKLASKHQRFSLLHPSSKDFPLCDVCQVKRAFLFCQQDRAILCRDCDVPIHSANEHTQKHNRFLLTGVRLSSTSTPYTSSATNNSNGSDSVPDARSHQHQHQHQHQQQQQQEVKTHVSVVPPPVTTSNPCSVPKISNTNIINNNNNNLVVSESGGSTSSISEYLIEMLPGWHVEDLLDYPSDPFGFSKSNNDGVLQFSETDMECKNMVGSSFSSENMGIWVPQAPTPLHPSLFSSSQIGGQIGFKDTTTTKEVTNFTAKNNDRRSWTDDGFTVPQISPPSIVSKRSRPNFW
ncbi:hypothetical protein Ddye_007177 [Dipteronia dyeriana]|uniref:B box-type domain-containing protein n=1 Tax=Dipteronia dyeriana TaxID=168575 RepID=A0AAD9XJF8_9ROSI|nr:hypothetical protein Ddye_007177 [Dipteronia dyeriana]